MILPHLNYSLLCWGFSINRLHKIQKKAIRTICMSKYNAHTKPLFKKLRLLDVFDLFKLNTLKLVYKYYNPENNPLPDYFTGMFNTVEVGHDYNTRYRNHRNPQPLTTTAKACIRYYVPVLLDSTQECITEKLFTHSLQGFSNYVKNVFINEYDTVCQIVNCYICEGGDNSTTIVT